MTTTTISAGDRVETFMGPGRVSTTSAAVAGQPAAWIKLDSGDSKLMLVSGLHLPPCQGCDSADGIEHTWGCACACAPDDN